MCVQGRSQQGDSPHDPPPPILSLTHSAYPVPPNLNHLGSDLCRGMLAFAERKPLGPEGLDWLKIHLANLCGKDKVRFCVYVCVCVLPVVFLPV